MGISLSLFLSQQAQASKDRPRSKLKCVEGLRHVPVSITVPRVLVPPRDPFGGFLPPVGVPLVGWPQVPGRHYGWPFPADDFANRYLNDSNLRGAWLGGEHGPAIAKIGNTRLGRQIEMHPKFRQSRIDMAEDPYIQARSFYYAIWHAGHEGIFEAKNVVTTCGLTVSTFTDEQVAASKLVPIWQTPEIALPLEKSMELDVDRFTDSSGNGIAIEIRVNTTEKDLDIRGIESSLMMDYIRSELKVERILKVLELIQAYPELYDKPIIFLQGNKAALRLYKPDGFEIVEHLTPRDKPKVAYGVRWWVEAVTPRQFEAGLFDLEGERTIAGLNQPHPFEIWNGQKAEGAPGKLIRFGADNHVREATLHGRTEVAPGIFMDAGTETTWFDKKIISLDHTANPADFRIPSGRITLPEESKITFEYSNRYGSREPYPTIFSNRKHRLQIPGTSMIAEVGAMLRADEKNELSISELAEDADFSDGITAARDTLLHVWWNGQEYEWTSLTLANDVVIRGVRCPAGARLLRSERQPGIIRLFREREGWQNIGP